MAFLGLTTADAALGAGALQAGSSIFGGLLGASGQAATNAQSLANSEMLFDQQQNSIPMTQQYAMSNAYNMRSTAYQATMADMKAAGLNPILAASNGPTGVTNIGGSMPSVSNPVLGNPMGLLSSGISSAGQAASTMANVNAVLAQADKDKSASDLNSASADQQRAQSKTQDALTAFHQANTEKVANDAVNSAHTADLIDAQKRAADASAAASDSTSVLNAARTLTEGYLGQSAKARAWTDTNFGQGHGAQILSDITRTAGTALQSIGDTYHDYVGGPFTEMWNKHVGRIW